MNRRAFINSLIACLIAPTVKTKSIALVDLSASKIKECEELLLKDCRLPNPKYVSAPYECVTVSFLLDKDSYKTINIKPPPKDMILGEVIFKRVYWNGDTI